MSVFISLSYTEEFLIHEKFIQTFPAKLSDLLFATLLRLGVDIEEFA